MQLDILAIGAHPDDIELCCGGTIAKLASAGKKTGIIDLTQGELGTRGTPAVRVREAAAAASILGCVRENLKIPDGNIEVNQRNVKKLMTVFRKYRPKMIIIPHWHERHPDHVNAHLLCKEAWFYSGLRKLPTSLNGKRQDPWRPDNYIQFMQWYEFTPSFIVDISSVYETRLKSIKAHQSQLHDPKSSEPATKLSHATFLDFVETRAKYFGAKIGVRHGEPFYSVEPVGIDDPLDLIFHKK